MIHAMGNKNSLSLGRSNEIFDNTFSVYHASSGTFFNVVDDSEGESLICDPSDPSKRVLEEIKTFLASRDKYKKYNIPFKRGIVLYGPPGTGKTATVKMIRKEFVKACNGIVVTNGTKCNTETAVEMIRAQEKDRPILLVFDDIQLIPDYLIEFMDGQVNTDGLIFLFTTNYFDRFPPSLKRPSRTDLHVEITGITKGAAASFMLLKFEDSDFESVNKAFKDHKIAMTHAILKEVMILRHVFGIEPNDALSRISTSGCDFKPVVTKGGVTTMSDPTAKDPDCEEDDYA